MGGVYTRRRKNHCIHTATITTAIIIHYIICIAVVANASSHTSLPPDPLPRHIKYARRDTPLPLAAAAPINSIGSNLRSNSFAINRLNNNSKQLSSCFATTHHQYTTTTSTRSSRHRHQTSSPIIASLFFRNLQLWKRPSSKIGIVKNAFAVPASTYLDTLSTITTTPTISIDDDVTSEIVDDRIISSSQLKNNNHDNNGMISTEDEDTSTLSNNVNEEEDDDDDDENTILIHTYNSNNINMQSSTATKIADATANNNNNANNNKANNLSLMGVGMSKSQFTSWVYYYLTHMSVDGEVKQQSRHKQYDHQQHEQQQQVSLQAINERRLQSSLQPISFQQHQQPSSSTEEFDVHTLSSQITTQSIDLNTNTSTWEEQYIPLIREYWKVGKLLCEHTNLLHPGWYVGSKSKTRGENDVNDDNDNQDENRNPPSEEDMIRKKEEEIKLHKQEQFRDVLSSYSERLVSIVEDELSDKNENMLSSSVVKIDSRGNRNHGGTNNNRQLNFGQVIEDLSKRIHHTTAAHSTTTTHHHQV